MPADRHIFFDSRIGERIRARRETLDMTQTALGKEAGVSYQQIQKYENGSNRISASALMDIAHALRMEISAIYDGIVQEFAAQHGLAEGAQDNYVSAAMDRDTAQRLRDAYARISDAGARALLCELAERLAAAEAGTGEPAPAPAGKRKAGR